MRDNSKAIHDLQKAADDESVGRDLRVSLRTVQHVAPHASRETGGDIRFLVSDQHRSRSRKSARR